MVAEIKEEGNVHFKEKEYTQAYELYTAALAICKHMQTDRFVSIDSEMLSTIFSNRAACLLKIVSSSYFNAPIYHVPDKRLSNETNMLRNFSPLMIVQCVHGCAVFGFFLHIKLG